LFPGNFLFLGVDHKISRIEALSVPGLYLFAAFLYILLVLRPELCFHYLQPPFLLTSDFLATYLEYPGGLSEWFANLIMQSFFARIPAVLVFFILAFVIWGLSVKLLNFILPGPINAFLALLPFTLSIVLLNNYNFPFSVTVSLLLILLLLWLLAVAGRNLLMSLVLLSAGGFVIYYTSGSGFFFLYSIMALFFVLEKADKYSLLSIPWVLGMALAVYFISDQAGLQFISEKAYFLAYEPGGLFYVYILCLPVFLLIVSLVSILIRGRDIKLLGRGLSISIIVPSLVLVGMAWLSHNFTFNSDARKIVLSDYYAYHGNADRTGRAARSMENYSFAANVNYNLAISKQGRLTEDFFSFFQISGSDALHPDVAFSPEMLFIASDFYYELGFISEARHNAYEALVFYPYSPRALQLLVKIHLIMEEYKAAERCLNILKKGLVSRKVVNKYRPLVEDESLVSAMPELMEKRFCIPEEKELSPYIDQRFRDLLEVNSENKKAYECLMLYYLLEGELEPFMKLYADADKFSMEQVEVYEEAILMYGMSKQEDTTYQYQVSGATRERFEKFSKLVNQYEGQRTMARKVLYHEMGESYMYYLGYLFPRIVKPEYIEEEYDEAPI